LASNVEPGVRRAARLFDGWFPIGPSAETVAERHGMLRAEAERHDRKTPTTAVYLTLCLGDPADDPEHQIDDYLTAYYGVPASMLRAVQACRGGTLDELVAFIESFVAAGADHLVLRIVGDHELTLRALAGHPGLGALRTAG
jgi:alkanesulfonate monooxygenase SsuD/methylene tetrahydromethanopterin reductase-like flavin-dependent oxidoreductase (luciferase family)